MIGLTHWAEGGCPSLRAFEAQVKWNKTLGAIAMPAASDRATLHRFMGIWQVRASRAGGGARLSVDVGTLDEAFQHLGAFLGSP